MGNVQKLIRFANKLGGSVERLRPADMPTIITPGYDQAPFINPSVGMMGVFWKDKKIVFCGRVTWPALLHEMAHIFASKKAPYESYEPGFLGWEFAVARYLRLPIKEMYAFMRGYKLPSKYHFRRFYELTNSERVALVRERIEMAKEKRLIKKNKPVAIR